MKMRQDLSSNGLHSILAGVVKKVPEHRKNHENIKTPMVEALKSGFAVFSLKSPSLLIFEKSALSKEKGDNIKSLYDIENIPSDTQLREILDPVSPDAIAPAFKKYLRQHKEVRISNHLFGM